MYTKFSYSVYVVTLPTITVELRRTKLGMLPVLLLGGIIENQNSDSQSVLVWTHSRFLKAPLYLSDAAAAPNLP